MCIISIAWQHHPNWKLIALGNRDELHARPATPISRWENQSHLIAGKDIQAGGTWLGVSEQGRFAVVTNVAQSVPPTAKAASRGSLLKDFLTGDGQYADLHLVDFSAFNPFNIITISDDIATMASNHVEPVSHQLSPGIYGLSNGPMDDPWKKSARLNQSLDNWLENDSENFETLLGELYNQQPYSSEGTVRGDAVKISRPEHSAIFIKNPVYGTRCSSLVAIDHRGTGVFIERRFDSNGTDIGQTRIEFSWPT